MGKKKRPGFDDFADELDLTEEERADLAAMEYEDELTGRPIDWSINMDSNGEITLTFWLIDGTGVQMPFAPDEARKLSRILGEMAEPEY